MKIKFLSLLVAVLFISTIAFSQEADPAEAPKVTSQPKNIFKVNLTAIALKNYSFQYERILSRKFSVAFGYRTMPTGKLPLINILREVVGDDEDAKEQLENFRLGNTAFTPEVRFYTSKKGYGRGFYLAPYYRQSKFKGSGLKFTYENSLMQESTVTLAGELKGSTLGLLMGAQWKLGKRVNLDWWILGPSYGKASGNFTGLSSKPLTQEEQDDLRQELEDFDLPLTDKTINVNANGATVKLDGPFAGIRSGILIGIRF